MRSGKKRLSQPARKLLEAQLVPGRRFDRVPEAATGVSFPFHPGGSRAVKLLDDLLQAWTELLVDWIRVGRKEAVIQDDLQLAASRLHRAGKLLLPEEPPAFLSQASQRLEEALVRAPAQPLSGRIIKPRPSLREIDPEVPAVADEKAARAIFHVRVVGEVDDFLPGLQAPSAEDLEQKIALEARRRVQEELDV